VVSTNDGLQRLIAFYQPRGKCVVISGYLSNYDIVGISRHEMIQTVFDWNDPFIQAFISGNMQKIIG